MRLAFAIVAGALASVFPAAGSAATPTNDVSSLAYFAPTSPLFYRMRYPEGGYREFERDMGNPAVMRGANGWKAVLSAGDRITVTGAGPSGRERYVFDRGRLVSFKVPGATNSFAYAAVRRPPDDAEPPFLFGSRQEAAWHRDAIAKKPKGVKALLRGKWRNSGRLGWPFANPNENGLLYASFALLSLALVAFRRRPFKIAAGVLFVAFSVPMFMTASRGAILALVAGLTPFVIVRFRSLVRSKAVLAVAAAVVVFAGVWFATHDSGLLTRGFKGKSSWSNEVRKEMWRMAPAMMVDAPGGWQANSGKAYIDWYEDFDRITAPGSLINDHLSKMVCLDWTWRGLYAFGWFALLSGLFFLALRTKDAAPVGVIAAFAVATWFNPLMINRSLWIAPGLALAVALAWRPWRWWRDWCWAAGCGAIGTVAAVALILVLAGRTERPWGIEIHADGPRVVAGGKSPQTWIVDDGRTLGGVFACKEIRSSLVRNPIADGVGYVRSCAALPESEIGRLVLAGDAGDEWLHAVSSDERLRERLPKEVVFLSPPFPPSAIPPPLFECAKVRYVTGEFNARYEREFDEPPLFVEIVPAMELYLIDWMRYASNR